MMEMGIQDLAQLLLLLRCGKMVLCPNQTEKMTQITIQTCSSVITYEAAAAELQATEAHQ